MLYDKRQPSLKDKHLKQAGMPTEKLAKDNKSKKVAKTKEPKVEKKAKKSK